MRKDELIVGAVSLVVTCVLLGLRQLIVVERKFGGTFIAPLDRDDGDLWADDTSDDWPSELAVTEEPASAAKASSEGTTNAARAGILSALVLLSLCGAFDAARAQQTIFNVPSTDVLGKGKVYAELDASFKPNDSEALGRFSSFVPRVVVGAGGRVEVGLNVTGNVQPGPDTTTLVPVVKYKFYDGGENGFAVVVGDHLFIPVRRRAYNAGNYVYLELSKTFKKRGTRLTAGGYDFTKSVVAAANRVGGQFGFEQPVNKKVTLAADYFTGRHAAGYFTPGVVFKLGPKATGYAGYSIGNQNPSRGNHFFLLELGYNFN
ncbi:MAG TPA: hypothetical protein VHU19_05635 [Pyrinomonadaceae bacterium]|jgi:hypothetical protein|nr:hypothetical protein [Pyrinomonadaceae bacterium]